jgi:hypothetical protein
MATLNIVRVGLAAGVTSALLYVGCMITMRLLPEETTIRFFNSLLHGMDVTSVLQREVALGNAVIGIGSWFVICFVLGVLFAAMYNLGAQGRAAPTADKR